MLRGINRQNLFEDHEDRERFLNTIQYYKTISEYLVYGYCLMDNHIHLILKETMEPIGGAIKRVSSSYVYWYNDKYERCGQQLDKSRRDDVLREMKKVPGASTRKLAMITGVSKSVINRA